MRAVREPKRAAGDGGVAARLVAAMSETKGIGRRRRRGSGAVGMAGVLAAGGCIHGETFRGSDGSALMPKLRAEWAIPRAAAEPARADAVHYQPVLAAQATLLDGDFAEAGERPDYRVWAVHVAFQPEVHWRGVQLAPFVGLGYQRVDLDTSTASRWFDTVSPVVGAQLTWRGLAPLLPFARYEIAGPGDVTIARGEVGLELLLGSNSGLQVGYGRQRTSVEEFLLLSPLVGDSVRIDSEGVHVGFVLRF
jgi:hypothetical protein